MKISAREQALLWLLANLLVLSLCIAFVFPKFMSRYMLVSEELKSYQLREDEAVNLTQDINEITKQVDALVEEIKYQEESFFPTCNVEDFQMWLAENRKNYKVGVNSLSIVVNNEYLTQIVNPEVSETEAAEVEAAEAEEELTKPYNGLVVCMETTLKLSGSYAEVIQYINHLLHQDKYLTVRSLQVNDEETNVTLRSFHVPKQEDATLGYNYRKVNGKPPIWERDFMSGGSEDEDNSGESVPMETASQEEESLQ